MNEILKYNSFEILVKIKEKFFTLGKVNDFFYIVVDCLWGLLYTSEKRTVPISYFSDDQSIQTWIGKCRMKRKSTRENEGMRNAKWNFPA